jgi:hypothetical protein
MPLCRSRGEPKEKQRAERNALKAEWRRLLKSALLAAPCPYAKGPIASLWRARLSIAFMRE